MGDRMGHDSSEIVSLLDEYIFRSHAETISKTIDVFTSPQSYNELVFL